MNPAEKISAVERNSFRSSFKPNCPNGMNSVLPAVLACVIVGVALVCTAAPPVDPAKTASGAKSADKPSPKPASKYISQSVRGKVVWLSEALARKYGVRLDADAAESLVALETAGGELLPIMKEARGRGFWKDERLRGVDLELMIRRYQGVPLVQVLRVFRLKDGKKLELDYWCEVCAIQMFELKQCECCQGPTVLRERPVEK